MPESVSLGIQHNIKNHEGKGTGRIGPLAFSKQATVKSQEQAATGRVLRSRFFSDYERRTIYLPMAPDDVQRWGRFFGIRCEIGRLFENSRDVLAGPNGGNGESGRRGEVNPRQCRWQMPAQLRLHPPAFGNFQMTTTATIRSIKDCAPADAVHLTILYLFACLRRGVTVGSGFPWFSALSIPTCACNSGPRSSAAISTASAAACQCGLAAAS
jgi:hypothetical protein